MLTFIIPVRHPLNCQDWARQMDMLVQTANSIALQDCPDWQAIVIVNTEAAVPALPNGFKVTRVDFEPNPFLTKPNLPAEELFDAIRFDKGRRILAGMLSAQPTEYFMVVDDDDFVHRELAGFVKERNGEPGWCLRKGYVWADGGSLLYRHPSFNKFCGTSHIVRASLLMLPNDFESASPLYIRRWLGSHVFIENYLRDAGTPLSPLPFFGAVYRIGHAGSVSKSPSLLRKFVFRRYFVRRPWLFVREIVRLRLLTPSKRRLFFASL